MGIKMIIGRQSKVLSKAVYKDIGEALKNGKENIFLIVPEQYTLGAEESLIKTNGLKGLMGAEVLSLKRLGDRILKETGGLTKTFVDSHGKNMLLQKTLIEVQNQLKLYGASVRKPGFLQSIGDFIRELKENEIFPETLETLAKVLKPGIMTQKLEDIHIIYNHFNALLGEDRLDQEDRQSFICSKLPQGEFLKCAEFYFDGFQNFSNQDYKIIRGLINTTKEVRISLTLDFESKDTEIFRLTKNTFYRIKEMGAQEMISFEVEKIPFKKPKSASLCHLEKNSFAYPLEIYNDKVEDIILTQAQNTWEEVEKGAQKILSLVRDENFSYKDIIVLTGDLDEYGSIIKRIFAQYQIPFFMDDLRGIGDNQLIEGVMAILETIHGYFRFDDIFGFIKTGFSKITLEEAEDLENYALEFGIRGSQWEREFLKISENESLDLERLNALRVKLIEPLKDLREKMKGKKNCVFRTACLYEFLIEIGCLKKIEALINEFLDSENYEAMETYNQIWNILMEVFDQIGETMGAEEVSLEEYVGILKSGFQGYRLGIIPPYKDVINITDLKRSRSGEFQILMVFGLNEGIIPGTGSEPNLITDGERQILAGYDLYFQNNREFQMDQENFLVYELFTKPENRLYLYWALTDQEGNSRQPSILVSQITEIFPELEVFSTLNEGISSTWDKISGPDSTFWHFTHFLSTLDEEKDEEKYKIWGSTQEWFKKEKKYQGNLEALFKALNYQGVLDEIQPQEAINLYGKSMETSISRLEKYRQCPFSHFVAYGLKPKGRPVYEIKALEIGDLLHSVVEGFFKTVDENKLDVQELSKEKRDEIVEAIIAKKLPKIKSNVFNSSGQYQYLGKKLERVGKKSVDMLIEHLCAGAFVPKCHEFSFKEEIELPKAIKAMDLDTFKIWGKIDRLDLYENDGSTFVKIVDYKTGLKKLSYSDIYYGLSLQLLVYLDGAIKEIGGEEIFPGGTFYFHLDDPIPRVELADSVEGAINKAFKLNGLLLDEAVVIEAMDRERDKSQSEILPLHHSSESKLSRQEFKEILDYVGKTVIKQVTQIYKGDIRIKPYKKGSAYGCEYCDYKGICQFDEGIRQNAYDILEKSIKKDQFFHLIKEDDHEMD